MSKMLGKVTKSVLDPGGMIFKDGAAPAADSGSTATAMPTEDDQAVAAARRRKVAAMQNRGGRASTILSQDDRLGG